MKKKNKIIITVVLVFALLIGVIGYASGSVFYDAWKNTMNEKAQKTNMTEVTLESFVSEMNLTLDMKKKEQLEILLTKQGYEGEILQTALEAYADAVVWYNVTPREEAYLLGLMAGGCDYNRVMSIYIYLKKINDDIYLTDEVYNQGKPYFENKYWLSQAYEQYKGIEPLSVEDIYTYVENGVTADEILRSDEMSLQTKSNIRGILNERQQGKSWYEIAAPRYGLPEDAELVKEPSLEEILHIAQMAILTDKNIKDIYTVQDGVMQIKEEIYTQIEEKETEKQQAYRAWQLEKESETE